MRWSVRLQLLDLSRERTHLEAGRTVQRPLPDAVPDAASEREPLFSPGEPLAPGADLGGAVQQWVALEYRPVRAKVRDRAPCHAYFCRNAVCSDVVSGLRM